jgi:hypothetical protein
MATNDTYVGPTTPPADPPTTPPTNGDDTAANGNDTATQGDANTNQANANQGVDNTATDNNGEQNMQPPAENTAATGGIDIVLGDDPTADANATVLNLGLVDAAVGRDGDAVVHVNGNVADLGLIDVAAGIDGNDGIVAARVGTDLTDLGILCDDGSTAQGAASPGEDVGITLALGAATPADFGLFGDGPLGVAGVEPLNLLNADPLALTDGAPLNLAALDVPSLDLCSLGDLV